MKLSWKETWLPRNILRVSVICINSVKSCRQVPEWSVYGSRTGFAVLQVRHVTLALFEVIAGDDAIERPLTLDVTDSSQPTLFVGLDNLFCGFLFFCFLHFFEPDIYPLIKQQPLPVSMSRKIDWCNYFQLAFLKYGFQLLITSFTRPYDMPCNMKLVEKHAWVNIRTKNISVNASKLMHRLTN